MNLRKSVPLWLLLAVVLVAIAVTTTVLVLPGLLSPKPDIALSSPGTTVLAGGGPSFVPVNVISINKFTGIVSAKILQTPTGMTANFCYPNGIGNCSMNPDAIPLGTNQTVSVVVSSVQPGNFTLTMGFTSGPLKRSIGIPIIVQGLNSTYSPSPLVVPRGSKGTVIATLQSQNGLSGTITEEDFVFPPGINLTITPKSAQLPAYGQAQVNFTVSIASGAPFPGTANLYFSWILQGSASGAKLTYFVYTIT